jgi:hypothetical protein
MRIRIVTEGASWLRVTGFDNPSFAKHLSYK